MTDQSDFTKPPVRRGPRQLLSPTIARGRQRDLSHERRPVPPIEATTVLRVDSMGMAHRTIAISLPRVKFLERPEQ